MIGASPPKGLASLSSQPHLKPCKCCPPVVESAALARPFSRRTAHSARATDTQPPDRFRLSGSLAPRCRHASHERLPPLRATFACYSFGLSNLQV